MGAKLEEYFKKAEAMGALKAKMRLAMMTGISSVAAKTAEESPENIKKFDDAMVEISKEFK